MEVILMFLGLILLKFILDQILYIYKNKRYKNSKYNFKEENTEYRKEKKYIPSYGEFEKKSYLLSQAENNFYNVLKIAIDNDFYMICPKVRIADFVTTKRNKNWQANFNRISKKHIDFLICNKFMMPRFGIELDDKSHDNQEERDEFVNKLYEIIDFPILRIKANYNYSVQELKSKINEIVNNETNNN